MSQRVSQILEVLQAMRTVGPKAPPQIREARIAAVRSVAARQGITPTTVQAACQRRLALPSISEFDQLIETWLTTGDRSLQERLEAQADGQVDQQAIQQFFGNGSVTIRPRRSAPTPAPGLEELNGQGTVPDYQTLMLPLLNMAADQQEHRIADAIEFLSNEFQLTNQQRSALIPSGRQTVIANRTHWARTYLKHAGLLENTGRGRFRITQTGLAALRSNPSRIDVQFLMQYPEFIAFRRGQASSQEDLPVTPVVVAETPEELLATSYRQLRATLAQELLECVKKVSPAFFERLVLDLLVRMGYGGSLEDAAQAVGRTGDGGIDGIIKEDRLGLDAIYIQAKRWNGNVGRPVVQAFAGSLIGHKASKGVMISTSEFTADARDYVTHIVQKIVLIGGEELARLMIDYGVGVSEAAVYRVFKVDTDYFGDE
jgi:restriction system protein